MAGFTFGRRQKCQRVALEEIKREANVHCNVIMFDLTLGQLDVGEGGG